MFPKKFRNIFVTKTIFANMFINVSNTSNIVFPIRHVRIMFLDYIVQT